MPSNTVAVANTLRVLICVAELTAADVFNAIALRRYVMLWGRALFIAHW
jgi:hypothetical protein